MSKGRCIALLQYTQFRTLLNCKIRHKEVDFIDDCPGIFSCQSNGEKFPFSFHGGNTAAAHPGMGFFMPIQEREERRR